MASRAETISAEGCRRIATLQFQGRCHRVNREVCGVEKTWSPASNDETFLAPALPGCDELAGKLPRIVGDVARRRSREETSAFGETFDYLSNACFAHFELSQRKDTGDKPKQAGVIIIFDEFRRLFKSLPDLLLTLFRLTPEGPTSTAPERELQKKLSGTELSLRYSSSTA